jgi:hypothetical protein
MTPDGEVILPAAGYAAGDGLREIHRKHAVNSSAFLTAYNPFSGQRRPLENAEAQSELVLEVSKRWAFLYGEGSDIDGKWPPEPSILILGITLEEARGLAKKYQQNAFLFGNEKGLSCLIATSPEEQTQFDLLLKRRDAKLNIRHALSDSKDPKWLLRLLRDTEKNKWCTKIYCTTCGSMDFRRKFSANIDLISNAVAQNGLIQAIQAISDEEASKLDNETLFWSLGLMFYEVGLWSPSGKAWANCPSALEGSWAQMFFTRIEPQIKQANNRRGY